MHIYHCHLAGTMTSKGVIKAKKAPRKNTKKVYKSTACKKRGLSSCANTERGISKKKTKTVRKKVFQRKNCNPREKKDFRRKT